MKMYWLKVYKYCIQQGCGRPISIQARVIQTAIDYYIQPVLCQRIFVQGPGFHYIYIVLLYRQIVVSDSVSDTETICQLLQTVAEYQQEDQQTQNTTIQTGELDKATPWLNRTGQIQYLQGILCQSLIVSIQRLDSSIERSECTVQMIWYTIERLVYISQEIAKQCGYLMRIEMVHTIKNKSPHYLLLIYLDTIVIKKYIALQQYILMFFARIQVYYSLW